MPASFCATCGSPLESGRIGGLCPACLLRTTLAAMAPSIGETSGTRFAGYELSEVLGRGGNGVVYRARQLSLGREVALKMLLGGAFADPATVRRFQREATLAGGLRHPGIIPIYAVGEDEGQAFYTMELVEGLGLDLWVRQNKPTPRRCAEILLAVAEAIAAAHAQGIFHRDLKPSNILMDATARPRVADFGLARREDTDATATQETAGTPPYLAPELLRGNRVAGPLADIYGLGTVLYHCLTGRPPFQGGSVAEILAQVESEPPVPPRHLNSSVPKDLETVCLRCLEKNPAHRYATASDLRDDLARFLEGLPVLARPLDPASRLFRWIRRHPAPSATIAILASASASIAILGLHALDLARADRLKTYAADMLAASIAADEGDFARARSLLIEHASGRDGDLNGVEWRWLSRLAADRSLQSWVAHKWLATGVAFSPDGNLLATTAEDGEVRLWADGKKIRSWKAHEGICWQPAFSANGSTFLTSGEDGRCVLWDTATGRPGFERPGFQASISADGRRLATVDSSFFFWKNPGRTLRVWDVPSGKLVREIQAAARGATLSPDGARLAATVPGKGLILWDLETGNILSQNAAGGDGTAPVFSPDGRFVAAGLARAAVCWDTRSGSLREFPHPNRVWSVAFSPDSSRLLTGCGDRRVRFFATSDAAFLGAHTGLSNEVWGVAPAPGGTSLATVTKDGLLALWPALPSTSSREYPNSGWVRPLFSPDSRFLATGREGGSSIWDANTGKLVGTPPGAALAFAPGSAVHLFEAFPPRLVLRSYADSLSLKEQTLGLPSAGFSPNGTYGWTLDADGAISIRQTANGRIIGRAPLGLKAAQAALSDDGRFLLVKSRLQGGDTRDIWLVDIRSGHTTPLAGHHDDVKGLALSPDGSLAAYGSVDGNLYLWETSPIRLRNVFRGHLNEVSDVAFDPTGTRLASIEVTRGLKLWHLPTSRLVMSMNIPDAGAHLVFSPDGRQLAHTVFTGANTETAVRVHRIE